MPFVDVAGERLFYALFEGDPIPLPPDSAGTARRQGTTVGRRNLILVHGAAGSHIHWPAELRRLPGVTVYAPDLPGHGRSGGSGRTSVQAYADTIHLFATALGLKRASVVGHSMGGAIAQLLALRRTGWLDRMVIAGCGARLHVDTVILEGLNPTRGGDGFKATVDLICQRAYGPTASAQVKRHARELLLAVDRAVFYADYLACDAFDATGQLSQIRTPTLVIAGGMDQMVPPQDVRSLSELIPGAQRVEMPDAGHMMIIEKPTEVARVVSRFLFVL
jgi:pimeloyl-ACP methyl ester carboxylesterase